MRIYGAGMSGLLAANMLRRLKPQVCEAQSKLPDNHHALLRFRSDVVSKATGIPFRRVQVHKAVCCDGQLQGHSDLRLNNMYSFKVAGKVVDRSIINTSSGERFIAPDNFVEALGAGVDIVFGKELTPDTVAASCGADSDPVVSTIPMPIMMKLVAWKEPVQFKSRPIWSMQVQVPDCDVYQTIYYPDAARLYYRASITGGLLAIEYITEPVMPEYELDSVLSDFGLDHVVGKLPPGTIREQKYGKLLPVDPTACRRFVLFLTDRYRIYSLGRFATWRNILLDEVVHDVGVIEKLIDFREGYHRSLESLK